MEQIVPYDSLWHPMTVHFPVALLLLAAALGVILLFPVAVRYRKHLYFAFGLLLLLGTALLWLAYYTGNMAYSIEVRRICDPPLMKLHLYWSLVTSYTFTGACLLYIIRRWLPFRKLLMVLTVLATLAGSSFLAYCGHLGARLVYEQGAGVRMPPEDCGDM